MKKETNKKKKVRKQRISYKRDPQAKNSRERMYEEIKNN